VKGWILAGLLLGSAASARAPDEVVEAERSFAAYAQQKGVNAAFHSFIADDGLLFVPEPKPGKALLAGRPERPGSLNWWPAYAGMARSGDLGFTTGPFVIEGPAGKGYGHFFTIWKKQPDGSWRWVIDHGTPTKAQAAEGPDTPVRALAASTGATEAGPERGWQALVALEGRFAQQLARNARAAYLATLAEDARVMRVGPQPAHGRSVYRERIEAGPESVRVSHLGGGISQAGDLAYTYGDARWAEGGAEVKGHYVRIWQNRPPGWTLVVDELIPVPPPPKKG
jgi:ketosteroid isomerase-like protein